MAALRKNQTSEATDWFWPGTGNLNEYGSMVLLAPEHDLPRIGKVSLGSYCCAYLVFTSPPDDWYCQRTSGPPESRK